jgi:hypothetical protein
LLVEDADPWRAWMAAVQRGKCSGATDVAATPAQRAHDASSSPAKGDAGAKRRNGGVLVVG